MAARFRFALCMATLLASTLMASAQTARSKFDALLDSMPKIERIGGVAISPDGARLVYAAKGQLTVTDVNNTKDSTSKLSAIMVPDNLELRDAVWSGDSKRIAFVAELAGDKPAAQVWVTDLSDKPVKLADLQGYVTDLRFSPDGRTLALLFIEGIPRMAGPLMPMTPPAGVIEETFYEQRITTIDLETKAAKQVSPKDMYIYEYDYTPDGKGWVVSAAHGSGDNNWWIARLYAIDGGNGTAKEIYKPALQIAQPRVSPDGKHVAFIEGIMSDQGSTGGDIFTVPIGGGRATNLTPKMKASVTWVGWTGPTRLMFTENIDGNSGIGRVSFDGGVMQVWQDFEVIGGSEWGIGLSAARDGETVAVVRQGASTPPEVWAGPIRDWHQITSLNTSVKSAWGDSRNVHWMNGDQKVQGVLMLPKDLDASKKYPMIVSVHGGPSSACMPSWSTYSGAQSAAGYFVLCPNPRGSYGQGEAFTQGNVKDFGGGDFKDIMAGIDSLAKDFPIDTERLGIRGHSYGGYMTMWAESQTTRFKAAVSGAGLSNWLSYYGENDIDEWMLPFFGASVYDDPKVYAKSSPIEFVKNVKTPTLIVCGDRDGEVPVPQSFEWWHALKTMNVPVEFVVYPNEGHAINKPEHMHDMQVRTLEWFDKYLGANK